MKKRVFTLGLDFGTNSVRALLADVADGAELATAVHPYETGDEGIILDPADPNLARQNPADYITGIEAVIRSVLAEARKSDRSFDPGLIIGIGVDTTGSTPLPVDNTGTPLSFQKKFKKNPNAQAWLWKDHTGVRRGGGDHRAGRREHPEYLAKCGGTYSSEWFFSKILHCLRVDPEVFDAAVELGRVLRFHPGRAHRDHRPPDHEAQPLRRRAQGDVQRCLGRPAGRGFPGQARPQAGRSSPPALWRNLHLR